VNVPEGSAPTRPPDTKGDRTRDRIAAAALGLFGTWGFTETTVDDIAGAADVSRRTVFRHFPTKESILFADFVARRAWALDRLSRRPANEPALASLHSVMRDLSRRAPDRARLALVRSVIAKDSFLLGEQITIMANAFEADLIEALGSRPGNTLATYELRALCLVAISWVNAAMRAYLVEGKKSLAAYYDEVVAVTRVSMNDKRWG
jgi:AcrR family transcriptional regulator